VISTAHNRLGGMILLVSHALVVPPIGADMGGPKVEVPH
jgi:hypothetical protein